MGQSKNRQGARDAARTSGLAIAILAASFFVAYQFVGPAPPKRIVLATGQDGGAYQQYGERFAEYLAREGIEVELRETAGSVENLALLDSNDGVDIGFVQGGLSASTPTENVLALGSLYLEPFWLFMRSELEFEGIGDVVDKRIAAGAQGSGTRAVALSIFDAHGADTQSLELDDVSPDELVNAFSANEIDVAFVIGAPEASYIADLVALQNVKLRSMQRADAYVRRYPFLSKVHMPEGVLDLQTNQPPSDIDTVAVTAMLAARSDLHPAIVNLLLVAATDIHGQHNLLSNAGQFPTGRYTDLPLSEEAERFFIYGPPFLMRYLPFWAATLVDRLWVLLLPLIGLAIPLAKLVPPAYRWQIRRRLLRLYAELELIDPQRNSIRDDEDLAARLMKLDQLDGGSIAGSVPKGYTDDVYKLRRDIDLVRRRLDATIKSNPELQPD
jgi:TRAP transporter TAXI family solute receptor